MNQRSQARVTRMAKTQSNVTWFGFSQSMSGALFVQLMVNHEEEDDDGDDDDRNDWDGEGKTDVAKERDPQSVR